MTSMQQGNIMLADIVVLCYLHSVQIVIFVYGVRKIITYLVSLYQTQVLE